MDNLTELYYHIDDCYQKFKPEFEAHLIGKWLASVKTMPDKCSRDYDRLDTVSSIMLSTV